MQLSKNISKDRKAEFTGKQGVFEVDGVEIQTIDFIDDLNLCVTHILKN